MSKVNFQQLKLVASGIRMHGNGFIQLNLPNNSRLHVWPEHPVGQQKVYTGWHNHKFSFNSRVICGTLLHKQFDLVQDNDGKYNLYTAVVRDKEDTELVLYTDQRYSLSNTQQFNMAAGSQYTFNKGMFHESQGVGLTATIMTKTESDDTIKPIVLCPIYQKPDNDFNRYQLSEEVLWENVEKVFNLVGDIYLP